MPLQVVRGTDITEADTVVLNNGLTMVPYAEAFNLASKFTASISSIITLALILQL